MKFIFQLLPPSPIYNIYNPLLFFLVLFFTYPCLCVRTSLFPFPPYSFLFRAFLCWWFLPGRNPNPVILTSVVPTSFFGFLVQSLSTHFGHATPDLLKIWFGIFAFRKSRTAQESSLRTICWSPYVCHSFTDPTHLSLHAWISTFSSSSSAASTSFFRSG